MENIIKQQEGFTLIELILVIGIVGLLAVTSVYAYLSYKRSALLDFAVDNIISQFYQMRSETVYGEGNADRFNAIKSELEGVDVEDLDFSEIDSSCFGIKYNAELNEIHTFEVKFSDKKSWDGNGNYWTYNGCEDPGDSEKMDFDENVVILGVEYSGEDIFNSSDFSFVFSPPDGEIKVYSFGGGFESLSGESILSFKVAYGENASERFQRELIFDLNNQTASVVQD